jgi:signal transduction histidine kinase
MRKALCLIALAWPVLISAQQHADSLLAALSKSREDSVRVRLLNELARAYRETDSAKAMAYGKSALALAENLQWHEGVSRAYLEIALQYKADFNYKKALVFFGKSLGETADKRQMSKVYDGIGSVHLYQSNYSQALANYLRALKIDESIGDRKGIATTSVNIASVYYSIRDYPKSIAYFNKSLAQKIGGRHYDAILLRNLAAAYNGMGQKQKALDYFGRSLALCEAMGDNAFKSCLLSDIGLTYYDLGDYAKAIGFSKRALEAAPKGTEDKVNTAFSFGVLGDAYAAKARQLKNNAAMLDSAAFYLKKSIELHGGLHSIRGLYDDYTSLTEVRKLRGDFRGALDAYEKSIVYKDSIFNSENRETIKNLEDKRSIEIRDRELKISRITLEADRRQKWLFIFGIALLAIIVGLLFYQSRNRKRNNRKLNLMNADLDRANRTKTRLLSILNHDLRSPVNSFIHFIQFQKEMPDGMDEASKARIEDATIDSAKTLLQSMEDMLLWTKDQMDNFAPQPKVFRVLPLLEAIEKHFAAVSQTRISLDCDASLEVKTDEDYLKTIIRNLTANALNAVREVENPVVHWRAWLENGMVRLSVTDNGPGIDEAQATALFAEDEVRGVKSGLGLHLVRDLANAIGWTISVDKPKTAGTMFVLSE